MMRFMSVLCTTPSLGELAFALGTLALQDVAAGAVREQNFAVPVILKRFGGGLLGFAAGDGLWHRGENYSSF